MAAVALKRTVKNEILRPFALSSENPWKRLDYRFDEAEPWSNALVSPFIILPSNREDVRTDVLHAFQIEVDTEAIARDGFDLGSVELVLLTRDAFAKKISTFFRGPVSAGPIITVNIAREALENTSLSGRIEFDVMLVAQNDAWVDGRRIRRSGRLAAYTVTVSAEKKGHSFNFSKTTPAEFVARGLPSSTTYYIDVPQRQDLIEACDDVAGTLSILVHEDAWSTFQEIKNGDRAGESLGTMFLSEVVYGVLLLASDFMVEEQRPIEEGSVVKRLLGWISEKSGEAVEALEDRMRDEEGRLILQSYVQETLRVTSVIHRVRLGAEENV